MPTPILMPALSPTMESGTLAKWLKSEGDSISPGDVIAEIETDKATMEVEAVDEGTLGRILIQEGAEAVPVNQPIALLLEEGEDESALDAFDVGAASKAPAKPGVQAAAPAPAQAASGDAGEASKPAPAPAPVRAEPAGGEGGGPGYPLGVPISPLARRMAAQNGLDVTEISGSGPRGRIVKRDIEQALALGVGARGHAAPAAMPAAAPAPAVDPRRIYPEGSYEELPADNMRKVIARRLTQSFAEVPHFPLTIECELDALLKLRAELNAASPEGDGAYRISVNDFILKASALALMKVPDANASWAGDAILRHRHADIGVAVAIDGGLITPIVWQAETKGLAVISAEVRDLAQRAKARKLQPQEYQGGTFSVSNLGMYGVTSFASVVNQPQGAIMSVGAGVARAVVRDGAVQIATVMSITLTCDHRAVDGAVGARFLQAFKGFVEDPVRMML